MASQQQLSKIGQKEPSLLSEFGAFRVWGVRKLPGVAVGRQAVFGVFIKKVLSLVPNYCKESAVSRKDSAISRKESAISCKEGVISRIWVFPSA